MLEAARRYWSSLPGTAKEGFRFLHVSTDEVYGSLGSEGLFSEPQLMILLPPTRPQRRHPTIWQ